LSPWEKSRTQSISRIQDILGSRLPHNDERVGNDDTIRSNGDPARGQQILAESIAAIDRILGSRGPSAAATTALH
jgi:hypothetical protein